MEMSIWEALLLASSLSVDAFIVSLAYGSEKIRLPFSSMLMINLICSGILGFSLFLGKWIRPYLSDELSNWICFGILFSIGLIKLLEHAAKALWSHKKSCSKNIRFSFFNIRFVLSIYMDPEKADIDCSQSISIAEATSLAVALSLEGVAVGFGAAVGNMKVLAVFLASLLTDTLAILLGIYLGKALSSRLQLPLSWLSGAILLLMAFQKIV